MSAHDDALPPGTLAGLVDELRAALESRLADRGVGLSKLPPCPTCAGAGRRQSVTIVGWKACPDCVDGHVTWQRLVNVFNAVHGDAWSIRPATEVDRYRAFLRAVR